MQETQVIRSRILWKKYNRISDELYILQRGVIHDPLMVLPPELWIQILLVAIDSEPAYKQPIGSLLLLTLVSQHWCEAIINTPALWTRIVIGKGLEESDLLANLTTSLVLSRQLPIHLNIHMIMNDWNMTLNMLRPHKGRIRTIYLEEESPIW